MKGKKTKIMLIEEERVGRGTAGKKKRLKCFIKRFNDTLNVFSFFVQKQNIFIRTWAVLIDSYHYGSFVV